MPEAFTFPATWAIGIFLTTFLSLVGVAVTLLKYVSESSARSAENAVNLGNMAGQLSVITPLVPQVATLTAEIHGVKDRLDSHAGKIQALGTEQGRHAVQLAELRATPHHNDRRTG